MTRLALLLLVLATFPAASQTRARAWEALQSNVTEQKYLKHSLAVEAIMRRMAAAAGQNADEWGLAGLLHDIDIAATAKDMPRHGVVGAQKLRQFGFGEAVVHAVNAHDDQAGVARTSRLDHAVYCADQVYWMIVATGEPPAKTTPEALLEKVRNLPSKQPILEKVSKECAAAGLTMPQTFQAAHGSWEGGL